MSDRPSSSSAPAQRLGLRDRAREAVEQEPVARLGAVEPLHHHPADQVVGHEVAAVHVLLGLLAELALLLDRLAQDVAGGVVGQVEVGDQPLGLGALAGAGRAEQDEVQLAHRRAVKLLFGEQAPGLDRACTWAERGAQPDR